MLIQMTQTCNASSELWLGPEDVHALVSDPEKIIKELETWLYRHRTLLPTGHGTSPSPDALSRTDVQQPGHKPAPASKNVRAPPQHRLLYANILEGDQVWRLSDTSKTAIVTYTNLVKQLLDLPQHFPPLKCPIGNCLLASVCFVTEHLQQTWLPTGRVLVKPSGTDIEAVDVCKPLASTESLSVLDDLANKCLLSGAGSGCALIRYEDLLLLQARAHQLWHYVSQQSSLHPRPAHKVKMSHSNVAVKLYKANEDNSDQYIQRVPILVNIPWPELLTARNSEEALPPTHLSALSLLHSSASLKFKPLAPSPKRAPSGLPHFQHASKERIIDILQKLATTQPELEGLADEMQQLNMTTECLSQEAVAAVARTFESIASIGVDMGQRVELGIHGHAQTDSGHAAAFKILFDNHEFKNQTAQLQRKKAWIKLTLPVSVQEALRENGKGSLKRHWADGAGAFSILSARATAEAKRQHDRELGRRVSQVTRSLGAEAVTTLASASAEGPARQLQKSDVVLLAIGHDFSNPKGPFQGNKTMEHLLLRLHGLGFTVMGLTVSEHSSSQRCCNPLCQRPPLLSDSWQQKLGFARLLLS